MNKNSEIYIIYYCIGGYENYTQFIYLAFTYSLEAAKIGIKHLMKYHKVHEVAHPDMNINNNFTFVGYRNQCYPTLSFHGSGGGFIIESWYMPRKIEYHNIIEEELKTEKEKINI